MQFRPDMIGLIRHGHKTQTRRPTSPHDELKVVGTGLAGLNEDETAIESVARKGRARWVVGRTYAICPGRGMAAVGRVRLKAIRSEPLMSISEEDAKAEGFTSSDEFLAAWRRMYPRATLGDMVWVLTFELC